MNISLLAIGDRIENYTFRLFKALLESRGHQVCLVYLNIGRLQSALSLTDSLKKQILDLVRNSEICGLYVFTFNFSIAVEVTRHIKNKTNNLVIWGGPHAIAEPEECGKYADIVCFREGEEALIEIVDRFCREGRGFSKEGIPNIAFREEGVIKLNHTKKLAISLDALPFQDISFKNHYYVNDNNNIVPLTYDVIKKKGGGEFCYITIISRGCPFRCAFCLNSGDNRIPFSIDRSIDNVISELKQAKDTIAGGIDKVMFYDDDFYALPLNYIKEFAEKFKAQVNLPIHPLNSSAANFSEEKFLHLKRAGASGVIVGIQTISKNGREAYHSPATKERIQGIVETVRKYSNQRLILHLILGNPYEDLDDIAENFLFLNSLPKIFELSPYQLVIYPGTKLHERIKHDQKFQARMNEGYSVPYYQAKPELLIWNNLVDRYFARKKDLPRLVIFLLRRRLYLILKIIGFTQIFFISLRNAGIKKILRKAGKLLLYKKRARGEVLK